jgi:hypothetical protein
MFHYPKDGPMAGTTHIYLRHLLTACTVILGFLLAAPIARADCDGQAFEQPFTQWSDYAQYTLVGDGDLTAGGAGWDLDGADLVDDNEPWYVHGGDTPRALRLRAGDSATTPPICVSLAHPTMRFFLRNRGGLLGTLTVEVITSSGLALPVGIIPGLLGDDDWNPSAPLLVVGNLLDDEVSFRFTAGGIGGSYVIDDVYVDPYKKG